MTSLRKLIENEKVTTKKVGNHKYLITYTFSDVGNVDESDDLVKNRSSMRVKGMETLLDFDTFYTKHLLSRTLLRCIPEELIVFIFGKSMAKITPILYDFSDNHAKYDNLKYVGVKDISTKINIIFGLKYEYSPEHGMFKNVLVLVTIMPKDNFEFFSNTQYVVVSSGFSDTRRLDVIAEAARIASAVYRRRDLTSEQKHELEERLLIKLKSAFDAGRHIVKRIPNKFKKIG